MVKKALRRNGIYASHEVQSKWSIQVEESAGHYILSQEEKEIYRTETIKELLSELHRLLHTNENKK